MPKALVLSNGNLLIGFDRYAQVRDLYFPYVGLENHTGGHYRHRLGVFVDNQFTWLEDPSWHVDINYLPDSLTGRTLAVNDRLQLQLEFTDAVYNEKDIFLREVVVTNKASYPRLVKIFFHQQFEIYESYRKDTAYYDPHHQVIIHYKGRRVFLINARSENKSFDDYSVGLFSIEGHDGTYKDAEDGYLAKNPIEHGPVDSVIAMSLNIEPGQSKTVSYWVTVSKLMEEALALNNYVLEKTPSYLIRSSQNFWYAWTNRQHLNFGTLSPETIKLFKKSLLIIRTHADNRGAIIASCDSDMLQYGRDTYGYVWPRDGAFSAIALDYAGDYEVAKRFFEFCNHIITPDGYFMHKYRADEALGSSWHPWIRNGQLQLPIQEDETALVIYALWQHYRMTHDLEFIESIYNSLIKKAAEFMVSYRSPQTGLPLPSYDLWEEKFGTSTFTSAATAAALASAAKFADLLGKIDSAVRYRTAAQQIQDGILKYLYDSDAGYFYKQINTDNVPLAIDRTVDSSSAYAIFKFGILPPDDDRLTKTICLTLHKLGLTTPIAGMARYEGDQYYRRDEQAPGNPWFITTLWLAQYYLTQAQKPEDTETVKRLLSWATRHASPSGILSEQLDAKTGEQLSAAPLTWSHSEFVVTVIEYLDRLSHFRILRPPASKTP